MIAPDALLQDWRGFYGMIGTSAAALAGLTFVVIALAPQQPAHAGLRIFMTPTVVHFGAALTIAAILSMPGHTVVSLAASLSAAGLFGALYSLVTAARMYQERSRYAPALPDWIWNAILPCLCYLALLDSAAILATRPTLSLCVTGASALLLVIIGIHNVWDIAIWLVTRRDPPPRPKDPE